MVMGGGKIPAPFYSSDPPKKKLGCKSIRGKELRVLDFLFTLYGSTV